MNQQSLAKNKNIHYVEVGVDNGITHTPPKRIIKIGKIYTALYGKDGIPRICIGPHWKFYVGLIIFTLGFILLFLLFSWNYLNSFIKTFIISSFINFLFVYSYTVFSNPGLRTGLNKTAELSGKYRICNQCNILIDQAENVSHCALCEVCIEGLDHHCPWTTKCIGRGNIISFYLFIVSSGVFIISIYIGIFYSVSQ